MRSSRFRRTPRARASAHLCAGTCIAYSPPRCVLPRRHLFFITRFVPPTVDPPPSRGEGKRERERGEERVRG